MAVGVNKGDLPDCYEALAVRKNPEDGQLIVLLVSAGVRPSDLKYCMEYLKLCGGSAED